MKMQQLGMVALLLSMFTFSACNKENSVLNPQKHEVASQLTFRIAIPKGDPVTYAPIHDTDEWGIESLWLYEFSKEGKLLKVPVDIKSSLTGTGPTYTYSIDVQEADKGSRQFYFVANEAVPSGIVVNSTIAQLEEKLASKTLAENASCETLLNDFASKKRIPMTGVAKDGNNTVIAVSGNAANVDVALDRIVARIDIQNRVPNLTITGVKLAKTNSASYLFPKGDIEVPSSATKVSGIGAFASLPSPFDNGKDMKKAFYLYEGHQSSEAAAVSVEVTGAIGDVPVFYQIPFWKDAKEVAVKRNHIYYLTLGDGVTPAEPNTTVSFTIEDNPWNEVTMNETFAILSAEYTGFPFATWDKTTRTLELDKSADSPTFNFTTEFKNHSTYSASISAGATAWITSASFSGNTLTIDVAENSSSKAREGVVTVKSDADANTSYEILIKQGA